MITQNYLEKANPHGMQSASQQAVDEGYIDAERNSVTSANENSEVVIVRGAKHLRNFFLINDNLVFHLRRD